MTEKDNKILESLNNLQVLRSFLESEMQTDEVDDGGITLRITVRNTAPSISSGSGVVFTGVALCIVDGREGSGPNWISQGKVDRLEDRIKERQEFGRGVWIGGTKGEFPVYTEDEESHGELLFPGESIVFELDLLKEELSYLDITVEGTISRRHLFHISQPMVEMKKSTLPLVAETFEAISKIDYTTPVRLVTEKMPEFGPNTTLADIDSFRKSLEESIMLIQDTMKDLNKVYHSAPNQEIRDLLKQYLGKYLTTSTKLFSKAIESLNSGDTTKMQEAAEKIRIHQLTEAEVKRQHIELMAEFELNNS